MKQIKLKFGDNSGELFSPVIFEYLHLLEKKLEKTYSSMWGNFKQSMLAAEKTIPEVLGMVVEGVYSERHSHSAFATALLKVQSAEDLASARRALIEFTLNGADWEAFRSATGIHLNKLYYCLTDYAIVQNEENDYEF